MTKKMKTRKPQCRQNTGAGFRDELAVLAKARPSSRYYIIVWLVLKGGASASEKAH
jgi:hypothetical protein